MARRSVAVLDSFGCKTDYTSFSEAKALVDACPPAAAWVSERCVQLLAGFDGGVWRRRVSGKGGPVVKQFVPLTTVQHDADRVHAGDHEHDGIKRGRTIA